MLRRDESAIILPFLAISIVVLLAVAGLTIDAGNLYKAQLALQNAADAGALAGINYIIRKDLTNLKNELETNNPPQSVDDGVYEITRSAVLETMAAAGYPSASDTLIELSPTPHFEEVPLDESTDLGIVYKYTVTVKRPIHYLLMHMLPIISASEKTLSATATSSRRQAVVALMLDVSDSTGCPAEGDCSCKEKNTSCGSVDAQRITKLKAATETFFKKFDLEHDIIVVNPFNIASNPKSITDLKSEYGLPSTLTETDIESMVTKLFAETSNQPTSVTNVCDALMTSYSKLASVAPGRKAAYVLFSDGAPSAGRFLFSDIANLPKWAGTDSSLGNYDYSNYTLEWSSYSTDGSVTKYYGPSVLYQTGLVSIGSTAINPSPTGTSPDTVASACGPAQAPMVSATDNALAAAKSVFGDITTGSPTFPPCLKSLTATLPSPSTRTYGDIYTNSKLARWREQYYNCAIELSDFFRDQGGIVYVIGLGPDSATTITASGDPYQDVDDTVTRKDVFLSRVANDHQFAKVDNSFPDFAYNSKDNKTLTSTSRNQGKYLPTTETTQIELLFDEIARKILLKLVN